LNITVQNSSPSTQARPGTRQHRWTARKLLKRAVLGITILFSIVGGGAWMLHAGIATDGARDLSALKSRPAVMIGRLADAEDGLVHGPTAIFTAAATQGALEHVTALAGEPRLAATLTNRRAPAIATLRWESDSGIGVRAEPDLHTTAEQLLTLGFRGFVIDLAEIAKAELDDVAERIKRFAGRIRHQWPATIVLLKGHPEIVAHGGVLQAIDGVLSTALAPADGITQEIPADILQSADFVATRHYLERVARAEKLVMMVTVAEPELRLAAAVRKQFEPLSITLVASARAAPAQPAIRAASHTDISEQESVSFSSTRLLTAPAN
jgi:hypothetical protein